MPEKVERQVQHIKESEMARGKSEKEATSIAWAKVKNPSVGPVRIKHPPIVKKGGIRRKLRP